MTKKRQRLKRRIRQLEHKYQQFCESQRRPPFDLRLDAFENEVRELGPETVAADETKAYQLLIYLELLSLARSLAAQTQHGAQSNSAYLLLRGMLEGLVDLKNLASDEATLNNLKLRYRTHRRKILTKAREGNAYLQALVDEDIDDLIQEQSGAIDQLEASGAQDRNVAERFEGAGMREEYDGWYAFFSEYVHRGLRMLEIRHLHQDENGKWRFPPEMGRRWDKSEIEKLHATVDVILTDARVALIGAGILSP